jgi:hypothetical protein
VEKNKVIALENKMVDVLERLLALEN